MKYKSKEKLKQQRQEMNATGGGPQKKRRLTDNDLKIIMICGLSNLDGNQTLPEGGFPNHMVIFVLRV